jgi:hypothetical protein
LNINGSRRERKDWSKIFFPLEQQWTHETRGRERSQMVPSACLNNIRSGEQKGMGGERRGTGEKVYGFGGAPCGRVFKF